jgi:SAM-dependent methyltransferase
MRFDSQAPTFDARAGVPPEACRAIAANVLELGQLGDGELLLEIGAGTGQLGGELLEHWPGYVGLDLSAPMLDEFRARLAPLDRAKLVQGDAAEPWPVPSDSVGVVLGSRVLHLLPPAHVAAEALRVRGPRGLCLLVGRVRRDPESVRARMRRQMRQLVVEAGFAVGARDRAVPELFERLTLAQAEPIAERSVARWARAHSPRAALDSWRAHRALAGVSLSESVHESILTQLSDWAEATFGSLDTSTLSDEEYVLSGVRLPPGRRV